MKLRRYHTGKSTAGRWTSADQVWVMIREERGWIVVPNYTDISKLKEFSARAEQVAAVGLGGMTAFRTRREAVAALELMLAGTPQGVAA